MVVKIWRKQYNSVNHFICSVNRFIASVSRYIGAVIADESALMYIYWRNNKLFAVHLPI